MRRIALAICGCALGVGLLSPGAASAAVGCNLAATVLTVTADGTSSQVSLDRLGDSIRVHEGGTGNPAAVCTGVDPPTVTNTDEVTVTDLTASGNLTLLVSLQGGRFEPGATPEPGGAPASEIEIAFDGGLNQDTLEVEGGDGADDVDLGQAGAFEPVINLNRAGDGAEPDCGDVQGTSIESVVVHGRQGDDDLNATACNGIGGATPLDPDSLVLEGNNNADSLRGGPGADSVLGGTQDDNVRGGDGDDALDGGEQDDKLDGGAGADAIEGGTETDRVLYDDRTTGITATIGNGGADDGGAEDQGGSGRDNVGFSVEHLTGGSAADSVTGSSIRNVINAGLGDDVVSGGDGNDEVEGEGGNDTLDGGGGKDEIRGQDGTDTQRGSGGADDLFGGSSADKLLGGAGGDFLKGDKGKDSMLGQAGNDKINAKDRKRDRKINCGKGKARKESAKVDKQDPKAKSC